MSQNKLPFREGLKKNCVGLMNNAIEMGHWPEFLKVEYVTPIPEISSPKDIDDHRNISGLHHQALLIET